MQAEKLYNDKKSEDDDREIGAQEILRGLSVPHSASRDKSLAEVGGGQ